MTELCTATQIWYIRDEILGLRKHNLSQYKKANDQSPNYAPNQRPLSQYPCSPSSMAVALKVWFWTSSINT